MDRKYAIVSAWGVLSLAIATAAVWIWLAGTDLDWMPREPKWTPEWVYDMERPLVYVAGSWPPGFPFYATQIGTGDYGNFLLGQIEREVPIDSPGRRQVEVDGVLGWLWMLESDQWLSKRGTHDYYVPYEDLFGPVHLYSRILRIRAEGVMRGENIAIQWNKDGIHYVILGRVIGGMAGEPLMTEEVLIRIANSLAPAEVIEKYG